MLNTMNMTKKLRLTVIIGVLAVIAMLGTGLIYSVPAKKTKYSVEVFKSGTGWGYNVIRNRKIVIHQPVVPVIENNIPFLTKEDALKTGKNVIAKLERAMNPSLSRDEIFISGMKVKKVKY